MKIRIIENNGILSIYTPFSANFVKRIKKTGAKWNGKAWTIKEEALQTVRDILAEVYGQTDITYPEDFVDIEIKFVQTVKTERSGIEFFGRSVVYATGRNSGVKFGEDVYFRAGEPYSGGSTKHWLTIIPQNSVCVITKVPAKFATEELKRIVEEKNDNIVCNIIPRTNKINREDLTEEKTRLLKRIEEIDKLLNNN